MSFTLVIHGGAGHHEYDNEKIIIYKNIIKLLLKFGYKLLEKGEKSIDVVQKIIEIMEDSGKFYAGKGGIRSKDGTIELDALLMEGNTLKSGAVSNVCKIKNPIKMARFIMDHTEHTKLSCCGAEQLAKLNGIELINPHEYYKTNIWSANGNTVGAIALDKYGNLAAASSTGGIP